MLPWDGGEPFAALIQRSTERSRRTTLLFAAWLRALTAALRAAATPARCVHSSSLLHPFLLR